MGGPGTPAPPHAAPGAGRGCAPGPSRQRYSVVRQRPYNKRLPPERPAAPTWNTEARSGPAPPFPVPRAPVPCSPLPARARPVTPPLAPRRTARSPAPFATRGGRSASALRSWEWGKTGRNITERRPDRTAAHRRSQPRPPPAPDATSPEAGWRLSVAPEGFLVSAPCRCGGPGPRPARIVPPPPRSAQ